MDYKYTEEEVLIMEYDYLLEAAISCQELEDPELIETSRSQVEIFQENYPEIVAEYSFLKRGV